MPPGDTKTERLAFGERLKAWRQRRGLTRPQLLSMIGDGAPTESTIRNIEGGHQGTGKALKAALVRLMEEGDSRRGPALADAARVGEEGTQYRPGRAAMGFEEIVRLLTVANQEDVASAAKAVAAATGQSYVRSLALVVAEKIRVS